MAQNVYQITLSSLNAGQFSQSVWHWKFEDSGFTSSFAAALQFIADFADRDSDILDCLPTSTRLLTLKGRLVSAPGGFEAVRVYAGGTVGHRAGVASASGVSPCVIFSPTSNGTTRGRWFIPGVAEADCVNGILTEDYKTDILSAVNDIFDDLTLTGGGAPTATFCIYHREANFATTGINYSLSDMVGTQRRRQRPA